MYLLTQIPSEEPWKVSQMSNKEQRVPQVQQEALQTSNMEQWVPQEQQEVPQTSNKVQQDQMPMFNKKEALQCYYAEESSSLECIKSHGLADCQEYFKNQ